MSKRTKDINGWFAINKAEDDPKLDTNEVILYDEVGYDGYDYGITLANFKKAVDELDDYTMRVHSPGGYVDTGLAIYDYNKLRVQNGATVNIQIDGVCASIATVIAASGSSKPTIVENGSVMIHPVRGGAMGTIEDIEEAADHMRISTEKIINIYMSAFGWDREFTEELLSGGDRWFHGQEAVDLGFASKMLQTTQDTKNCWDEKAMSEKYNYNCINKGDRMSKGKRPTPNLDADGNEQTETSVSVTLAESNAALMQRLDKLEAENGQLTSKLGTVTDEMATLTTANATLATAKEEAEKEAGEKALLLRKEELSAQTDKQYAKLGKTDELVALLVDVETNCSKESFESIQGIFARANEAITIDVPAGSGDDGEVNENKFRSEKMAELKSQGMSEFDAMKKVNKLWIAKQHSEQE